MSLTSGFFDSLNGDRKYNTLQLSSIFDGIISEGVCMPHMGITFWCHLFPACR